VRRDPSEVCEHPGVIKPIKPAFVVQRAERRMLSAGAEQLAQLPVSASAGLVKVRDRRRGDLRMHQVQKTAASPPRRGP